MKNNAHFSILLGFIGGLIIGFLVGRLYVPSSPYVRAPGTGNATQTSGGTAPVVNPFETAPVNPLQGAGYVNPLKDVRLNPFK